MKWIVGDFFERSPVLIAPTFALLLFVIVFTMAAVRALRAHKASIDRMASLPLAEDERRG